MASKKRVVCGLSVAAAWLAAIFLLPVWALAGVLAAGAIVCLYELCAMLKHRGYTLPFKTLTVFTVLWFIGVYASTLMPTPTHISGAPRIALLLLLTSRMAVLVVFFLGMCFWHMLSSKIEKPLETLALTLFSFFYIPVMLSLFLFVVSLGARAVEELGEYELVYERGIFVALVLVLVTKMSDTGGYFIGSAFGKHKMCPRLSPGKSWEGTAGGYTFSLTAAGAMVWLAHAFPQASWLRGLYALTETPGQMAWFFGTVLLIVTVGIFGDLLESFIKRQCGVKDSSALFPAMGGFFDTFDSILFVPLAFLFSLLLQYTILEV